MERFWNKVDKIENGCWNWTASVRKDGYGQFQLHGAPKSAHRVAWFFKHGRWPNDLLLHSCDNPRCVNPSHLREGTHQDNMRDRSARGRCARNGGEACGRAKLTAAQVSDIRKAAGTQRAIAAAYGVTQSLVSQIQRGVVWADTN
jgi:hypothetical protein